jgi:hypothetical protein
MLGKECMDYDYISMTTPRMGKINQFLFHWRNGQKFGYPICCIVRFSLEAAMQDGKTFYFKDGYQTGGMRRGMVWINSKRGFVPCGIFHQKTHDFEEESQKKHAV